MRKLLHLSFLLAALFTGFSVYAQDRFVTGKVTSSDDGTPLIGVSVQVKGTSAGVNTDANGNYRIAVPNNATLVYSFVGMQKQEVVVGVQTVINVELSSDAKELSEVVVTGYGQQIKRDVTGNIAKIKSSEISNVPVTSIESALQGRAAGVQINAGSGKLGQAIQVRVRGASSLSASSQPLYVVDGVPVTSADQSSFGGATNPMADINFNDVESVEILKDASAAAIYGSRAANGVVLITTKRGTAGKTNVSFNYQVGVSNPSRKVPFLNGKQYVDFYRMAAANRDRRLGDDPSDPNSYSAYMESFFEIYSLGTFNKGVNDALNNGTDFTKLLQSSNNITVQTDWQDQIFNKNAGSQQADLTFSGGNEKTSFFISGQYLGQTGTIIGNSFERFSGRINLDHKVSNVLSIGASMNLARTFNKRLSGDNSFSNPLQASALTPLTPAIDPETGLPVGTLPGNGGLPLYYNPVINKANARQSQAVVRNLTNVYAQINILPYLRFRSELGIDLLSQQEERYFNSKTYRVTGLTKGSGDNLFTGVANYSTNNYFNFDKTFAGLHALGATLGMSYQNSQTRANSVSGINFPSDAYRMMANAGTISAGSSEETNFRFLSYFLRANYKFNDRYLLSVSGRIDGSSRFGKDSKYGFFPAASAGWVLSEESFLKNSTFLSFLKLRGSYGLTGNAEIGNFPALGLYTSANYAGNGGQAPSQLANPNLKWETTAQTDIGIDFGFFNNRINGEVDYYIKKTSDLLLNVNVPATSGFLTQTRNVGNLENKGFELVINSQNIVGAFQWTTSLNLATNQNKVTNIQGQIIETGIQSMSRAVEGQPIATFFGREYAGVDPATGDALFYKNTTNADGTIDRSTTNVYSQAQRVVLGKGIPTLTGGITNTFSYKGIDLSIFFNGVSGNKINFYGVGQYSSANGIYEDNQTADQLKAWTSTNTKTNVPEARLYASNGNQASSRYLQDGSYLRLRTVTLGYNLPKALVSRWKLSGVRIYVTGQNLATFTNYKGWDPEVNSDDFTSSVAQGYDFYTPPQPKTLLAGINLKF
ncbi:SusC/RagA family TonB-linked outer membrane protein [Siphonobacter aquaeclarae]|uniref:TonB-linked outer membrane protein, SusC/RagA family n=1 Tax=Siphonobacter aquaeclarae TaxID=563176 RepID=A0A1G9L0R3_9BACT|nr:TonB-dependent receptor [Siphonobacter aquaeclarae]SDL55578.1 TonB-linked outer membrane protein, SusC/RagA family [Siphonobacter aquaeclarae]